MQNTERQDVYTRITGRIIESLEQGVRPWIKPWNAENAMGIIIRPLRHNGQAYSGINVLMLWRRLGRLEGMKNHVTGSLKSPVSSR
jgi:antirestriction protein ArdC